MTVHLYKIYTGSTSLPRYITNNKTLISKTGIALVGYSKIDKHDF